MGEQPKAGNASPSLIPASQESSSEGCSPERGSIQETGGSPLPIHLSTGPRTKAGKRRSKYNAVKNKLFAKAVVLDGESADQYEALRKSLWEEFQPETTSEMEDVEYLVTLYWRRRRIAVAENAEIVNLVNFKSFESRSMPSQKKWDQVVEQWHSLGVKQVPGGSPRRTSKAGILYDAVTMLSIFKDSLNTYRCHDNEDPWLRTALYECFHDEKGSRRLHHVETFPSRYDEEVGTNDSAKQDKFVKEMLDVITEEISRLEFLHDVDVFDRKQSGEYTMLVTLAPFRDFMDAIVRVQAHISREFEKTQNRLERSQRRRQGQPEPPTLRVEVQTET